MDYSLLVIKYKYPDRRSWVCALEDPHTYKHRDEQGVVFKFAIIDYLQAFNFRKRLELSGKKMANPGVRASRFSVQEPEKYASRFYNFIERITTEEERQRKDTIVELLTE